MPGRAGRQPVSTWLHTFPQLTLTSALPLTAEYGHTTCPLSSHTSPEADPAGGRVMSRVLKVELARAPDTLTTRGCTEVNRFCKAGSKAH
jgi:hypothetical protein